MIKDIRKRFAWDRRQMRMQTRFMAYFGVVVVLLMTCVILLMETRQSNTMLRQTEIRGAAVAHSIASVVLQSLYEYDYVYLQQAAETAARDEGVAYVIILDKEGTVAAYSGHPERVGHPPVDPYSRQVEKANEQVINRIHRRLDDGADASLLDIAVPVRSAQGGVKWGTIRIGLSLRAMSAELSRTRTLLVALGLGAIMIVLISVRFFSRQITQPLEQLASATATVASGNLEHAVNEDIVGELGDLAHSFNKMTNDLKRSRDAIRYQNHHLENMVQERTAALREKARELERANTELKELDRLKSDFLSNVSHELRTPLTSIRSFTEILLDRTVSVEEEQRREFLEIISSQSERLTRLISDLLDLSKIEAGEFRCHLQSLDLEDVVHPVLETLQRLAEENDIELVNEVGDDSPTVLADFDRLSQVITNLVGNSLKFTDPGGTITVSAKVHGHRRGDSWKEMDFAGMEADAPEAKQYLIVKVEDTGCGIKPEDQKRIFEKFGQVGNVLTDKPKGTGLGLTICGTIIVHHGGALWVESEEGKGSRFSFSLPVVTHTFESEDPELQGDEVRAAEEAQCILADAVQRSASGPRLLVVDDEPTVVSAISRFLEPRGYDSVGCYSGDSVLHMAREMQPDAILLDILLPDRNGFDVLKDLKSSGDTKDIPVIVVSGLDDSNTAYELGAAEYVRKPFDMVSLLDNVRALA